MQSFLKDTAYSNMGPLFIGSNLLIVSKEPKAKELLISLRASRQITLLGMSLFSIYMHKKHKSFLLIDVCLEQLFFLTWILFCTGACIDDTLLSAQGLMSFAKLPSYTVVQGELVSGLTVLTSRTASLLQHHPSRLSALLQQYVKQAPTSDDHAVEAT